MLAKYRRLDSKTWEQCVVLNDYGHLGYFVLRWDEYPVEDYSEVLVPKSRIRITYE